MPIRRQFRYLYPNDWPQLSAVIRFKRAGGRCEICGRPHGRQVKHLGDGRWWDEDRQSWWSRPRPAPPGRVRRPRRAHDQGRAGDRSPRSRPYAQSAEEPEGALSTVSHDP